MTPQVVVFDVLGTVLDERGGFRAALAAAGATGAELDELTDRWLGAVSAGIADIAAGVAAWRPWEGVIAEALARVVPADVRARNPDALGRVGRRLPAWPDSVAGIDALRSSCRVVALSNAGLLPLMECSRAAGIEWDTALSSEMVRSAKPDPRVYEFVLGLLRLDPEDVVMVAAHPWDLRAAAERGMRTAFVTRPGEGVATDEDRFDWTVDDLTSLSTQLGG
jgi:2-haloacid dehalogenase